MNNTPPDAMLRERDAPPPELELVDGDESTGIYKVRGATGDLVVEAYSWGQLTSGKRAVGKDVQRALWALLLPFALVNIALWARPGVPAESGEEGRRGAWTGFFVRLLGLSLTATVVLAAAGIGMDQVGWQCREGCARSGPGADFLHARGFWSLGMRPVVVGMLVPVAVLVLLWGLARRSFAYEAEIPVNPLLERQSAKPGSSQFSDPHFWSGDGQVRRLAALHLAVGVGTFTGLALAAAYLVDERYPASARPGDWILGAGVAAGLLTALALLLAVAALWRREVRQRAPDGVPTTGYGRLPAAAFALACTGLVATLVYLLVPERRGTDLNGPLPAFAAAIHVLLAVQFALVLLLAALSTGHAGRGLPTHAHHRLVWGGRGVAVLAGAGWAAACLYAVSALFWMADWLNGGDTVAGGGQQVVLPTALLWGASGMVALLAVLALFAAWIGWRYWRFRKEEHGRVLAENGLEHPDPGNAHERMRAREVAQWRGLNRLVGETALPSLGVLALSVLVLTAAGVAGILTGKAPAELVEADGWQAVVSWTSDTGGALAGLFLVALAAFIAYAYQSRGARGIVGVVWDVATFWPRAAHPFAPPCYAERVVPQLLTHVCGRDEPVVLAGYSQGGLLAVATVAQLPEARRPSVFLLTCGAQLSRLYGRVFPSFFAPHKLQQIATLLADDGVQEPRWRNLHRPTDPLGWEVGPLGDLPPMDVPTPDPDALAPSGGRIIDPPIRHHTNYHHSPLYVTERDAAATRLRTAPHFDPPT